MESAHFICGLVKTPAGDIPQVVVKLTFRDRLGAVMVRWSINRGRYRVRPGLYAVGKPSDSSDVFVTANYKLSFDHLRKNLDGLDGWILALDTKGVNVWCAAGKGTFSTRELVNRIRLTRLEEIVSHRRIIVPQLGATGVSAHEVKKLTERTVGEEFAPAAVLPPPVSFDFTAANTKVIRGFQVIFGPVKARHIPEFIRNRYVTTREMRRVTFTLPERAILIPNDFVYGLRRLIIAFLLLFILSGLTPRGYSFRDALDAGPDSLFNLFLAYLGGIVLTPLALPWLPGRTFAFKGFITGIAVFLLLVFTGKTSMDFPEASAWFLIIPAISSFTAMNFTGSSTYTSLSGVKKEMKMAVPFQISLAVIGLVLFIVNQIILLPAP